jgi:hypothetical protein
MRKYGEGLNTALIFVSGLVLCLRPSRHLFHFSGDAGRSILRSGFPFHRRFPKKPPTGLSRNELRSPQDYRQCPVGVGSDWLSCRLPSRTAQTLPWSMFNHPSLQFGRLPPRRVHCDARRAMAQLLRPAGNKWIRYRSQPPSTAKDERNGCISISLWNACPSYPKLRFSSTTLFSTASS